MTEFEGVPDPRTVFKYAKSIINLLNGFLLEDVKNEMVEGVEEDAFKVYQDLQYIADLLAQKDKSNVSKNISHFSYTCLEIVKFVSSCQDVQKMVSPLLEEKPFYKMLFTICDLFQRGLEREYRKANS